MTYKLTEDLLQTLEHLDDQKDGYVFHAITDKDKKMNKGTIRKHWEKVLEDLGVHLRMHDLRHLIGGTLVSSGKTLEQVASVLRQGALEISCPSDNIILRIDNGTTNRV